MVFRAKGAKTYKLRVDLGTQHAVLTTGCTDEDDASDVEGLVHEWQGRKGKRFERRDVLEGLLEKRYTLPEAVEAFKTGVIDTFLAKHAPVAPVVDLVPLIAQYVEEKRRTKRGGAQSVTYQKQLLALFPERPFSLASFTRKEVWTKLDALEVDAPTKNRYRTAASWLAKNLVKHELLDRNFVREIAGYGENDPRLVYYELDDAKRLIEGLEQPYAAIAALALGFCAEWGAIERAIVSDIALDANPIVAHVRGTKRAWRDRFNPLVPELAWTLDHIRPALERKTPTAAIIDGVPEWRAIDVIRATARRLKIAAVGEADFGEHSIHDWRHTHAVAVLRAGYIEQIAADHLGHKNTTLVRERYGRFKPTKHDYAKGAGTAVVPIVTPKSGVTKSITSARSPRRARGGKSQ